MPQPYQYLQQAAPMNLAQSVQAGLGMGEAIGGAIGAHKRRKRQAEFKERSAELMASKGNSQDWKNLLVEFPESADAIKQFSSGLAEQERSAIFKPAAQVLSLLENGNYNMGREKLEDLMKTYSGSGDPRHQELAEGYGRMIQMIESETPEHTLGLANTMLFGIDPEAHGKLMEQTEIFQKGRAKKKEVGRYDEKTDADITLTEAQADQATATAEENRKNTALAEREVAVKEGNLALAQQIENAPPEMSAEGIKSMATFGKEKQALNKSFVELESLQELMLDPSTGKPLVSFGGAPDEAKRGVLRWLSGQTDDSPDKDVFFKKLKEISMKTAFQLKQAGAMSDAEMEHYISTVPSAKDSDGVVAKWIEEDLKQKNRLFGSNSIRQAFLDKRMDIGPAKKTFTLEVNGKPIVVKKGEDAEDVIRKVGTKGLGKFAPSMASQKEAEVDSYIDSLIPKK
jgi:hypothetical protein